ncbi:hypothetical protein RhiirA4_426957 [Rhizophagus irregularis]|uniref:Uncharacterized protein n=1 Tax=Rhizophagus irregularis TaxID=588596 RepID=A0A2I1H744_9GLOM|nr:hypothetical protein RhiirA4_426957 [Rhizophagus irregularis]
MRTTYSNLPNGNVINTPAVTPNINGQILPSQISHFNSPQIFSNVCNGVNAFNPTCDRSCPLPGNNPFIVGNSPHMMNDIYQSQECSSTMRDYHTVFLLQQQKQKRVYEVSGFLNTWFPPPQINHLNIPQISPNVYNGVNALNPYCGNSCPLPGNNPSIVYNSPHAANVEAPHKQLTL